MFDKSLKTPLRYPGGKSKAIKTLSQWYPKKISEYREPFIGGGSIAIDVAKKNPHIPIWINDLYICLLYTSPSPRDLSTSRMPSSA